MQHPGFQRALGSIVLKGFCALLVAGAQGCGVFGHNSQVRATQDFPKMTGFAQHDLVIEGVRRHVWVFVPADYDKHKKYPTILFLHGLFEGGGGNEHVLTGGLGPVVARNADTWPFITIFPQSAGKWIESETEELALAALADTQQRYSVDPDRIVLSGLSYGGLGVWEIGARHHDLFAALVPMSAFSAANSASMLTDVPVWAFVGRSDQIVDPQSSIDMCAAIRKDGGQAKVTELEADHDCCAEAVDDTELVDWMLIQHRSAMYSDPRKAATRPIDAGGSLRGINDR